MRNAECGAERRLSRRMPSFRAPYSAPRISSALTLIELLVVMAIMVILASSLAVAVFAVSARGQERGTEALFEKFGNALEQYRQEHRMYVPQDLNCADADDGDLSTYPLWQALEHEGNYKLSVESKYKVRGDAFTAPETGAQAPRYYYQDAWKNAVYYSCPPPFDRYTLQSRGRDLMTNTDDDIQKTD